MDGLDSHCLVKVEAVLNSVWLMYQFTLDHGHLYIDPFIKDQQVCIHANFYGANPVIHLNDPGRCGCHHGDGIVQRNFSKINHGAHQSIGGGNAAGK